MALRARVRVQKFCVTSEREDETGVHHSNGGIPDGEDPVDRPIFQHPSSRITVRPGQLGPESVADIFGMGRMGRLRPNTLTLSTSP